MKRAFLFLLLFLVSFSYGTDEYDYTAIDRHVEDTPKEVTGSVDALTAYLVQPAKNEREKVRAIYYWIARNIVYDSKMLTDYLYNNISSENISREAEQLLKQRKGVCGEMANLFNVMARKAGLEADFVLGWIKAWNDIYGKAAENKFGSKPNHAWNRVKIDGTWQLLDLAATVGWGGKVEISPGYFGKGKVTSEDLMKDISSGKIKYTPEIRTHFFLTPPEILIETHFPAESQWQLLDKALTKKQFEELVFLMPAYFANDLELQGPKEYNVKTASGFDITLKNPKLIPVYAAGFYNDNYADYSLFMPKLNGDMVTISCTFKKKGPHKVFVYTVNQKFSGGQPEAAIMYQVTAK